MRTPRRVDRQRPGRRVWCLAFALLSLVALASFPVCAATYYVGASPGDRAPASIAEALQLAQSSAEADEIRLTRSLAYTGVEVQIVDWTSAVSGHLTFGGGYDDCLDATASGRTTFAGDGSGTLFTVAETGVVAPRLEVTLRDLELTAAGTGAGA